MWLVCEFPLIGHNLSMNAIAIELSTSFFFFFLVH